MSRVPEFIWIKDDRLLPKELLGAVVAVGNFDGVHAGHLAVLNTALAEAEKRCVPAITLTFEPHPRSFFKPGEPVFRLTPPAEKARLINGLGFSAMVQKRFDTAFARMAAADFVEQMLAGELQTCHVIAGHDFHFGKQRAGTPQFLQEHCAELNIGVTLVEPVRNSAGHTISSTRIRQALSEGKIEIANYLLGRRWRVTGKVVRGKQLGRTLGFPTANLQLARETTLAHGIYAVRVIRADATWHDGVASFGRRPTFDNGEALLESFLFDFSGSLYGEQIGVEFHCYLRGEEKFESAEALVLQMRRDEATARQRLAGIAR